MTAQVRAVTVLESRGETLYGRWSSAGNFNCGGKLDAFTYFDNYELNYLKLLKRKIFKIILLLFFLGGASWIVWVGVVIGVIVLIGLIGITSTKCVIIQFNIKL